VETRKPQRSVLKIEEQIVAVLLKDYTGPTKNAAGEFLPGTQYLIREAKVEVKSALKINLEAVS